MRARLPEGYANRGASNMNQMIKQAQKMQEEMAKKQEEIEQREFTASSGGGAVEVVMSGKRELKAVNLKPEVVDPEDMEMLQDLIIAAVNEVIKQVDETTSAEMEQVTGGLNIPGLF